jgi:DNA (cytosine-5)-methyltransferase 1
MKEMGDRRPPLALLENVPGFLTSKGGADFHAAMKGLNRLGYRVDPFFLDASRFVPQSRLRLFVVAILDDISHIPGFTGLDHIDEDELRPKALIKFIKDHKDINWAIRKLPAPPVKNSSLEAALEDLPETAPQWWRRKRAEYLLSQMSPRHRGIAESMIMDSHWSYGTIFRRVRNGKTMAELRTDGVAGCLRTPRGGSGRQILFKAGFGKYMVRLLTPRECARLMGADDYKIEVPDNQAFFGFGDAVCVPVIEWIAAYYLNPIACELIRGGIMYC